jgi:hypothetical protein
MATEIKIEITPQGLRIPRAALEDWQDAELEIVQENDSIVIRPKLTGQAEHEKTLEVLREAGLLYKTKASPTIAIPPRSLSPQQERELALQALREDGLLVEPKQTLLKPPASSEERAELSRKLSIGRPLSEIIIEERKSGW